MAWFGRKSREEDKSQFQAALSLSKALNRTLIAPMFQCTTNATRKVDCALYQWIGDVRKLPHNLYDGLREHYFLLHPLVPKSVSQSTTNIFYVLNDTEATTADVLKNIDMFKHFQIYCQGNISCQQYIFAIAYNKKKTKNDVIAQIKNLNESVMRILDPKSFLKYVKLS